MFLGIKNFILINIIHFIGVTISLNHPKLNHLTLKETYLNLLNMFFLEIKNLPLRLILLIISM